MDINEIKQRQIDNFKSDFIVSQILSITTKETGFNLEQLRINSRKRELVFARHLAMYFIDKHTKHTLDVIGHAFNRDHATVLHGRKVVSNLMDVDKSIKIKVQLLDDEIQAYKSKTKTKFTVFKDLLDIVDLPDYKKQDWLEEYLEAI